MAGGAPRCDRGVRCSETMRAAVRTCLSCFRSHPFLIILCLVFPVLLHSFACTISLPASFASDAQQVYCPYAPTSPPSLDHSQFCTGGQKSECFPRVRGLCFYASEVKICKQADFENLAEVHVTSVCNVEKESHEKEMQPPTKMRFRGERITLPVVHSSCGGTKSLISGLSMVADQRFLPYKRPNPHHEAEKLIPALLLSEKCGMSNMSLYWFSSRENLSEWAKGFLKATNMYDKMKFVDLPEQEGTGLCFEEAILFSAPTNLWYIPDQATNKWLRELVLQYCSIAPANVSWPVRSVAILDRTGGPRRLANKQQVANIVSQVLNVPVRQSFSGVGSFCDQVRAVMEDDLLIVPHGSQNVNLIFARPGTIVIEVFPHLFYTNALRNYTHAAELNLHSLLGVLPQKNFLMWVLSWVGWDACYYKFRWCKNLFRRQLIYSDTLELEKLLAKIKDGDGDFRHFQRIPL